MTLPDNLHPQVSPADFRWVLIRAVLLPLILSAALAGVFLWQISRLTSTAKLIEHTDEVISQATAAQKLFIDMETGVRGYLITADRAFLKPYEQAMPKVSPTLGELRRLSPTTRGKGRRLDEVGRLYALWSLYARDVIALKEGGGQYQARGGAGRGSA